MKAIIKSVHEGNNAHEEVWSFNIPSPISICNSCSSNSVSSMEVEGFMTHGVVSASELFDGEDNVEIEPKRRKTTPDDGYFFNVVLRQTV